MGDNMRGRNSYTLLLAALVLSLGLFSPPLLRAKLSPQEKEERREQRAAEKQRQQQLQAQNEATARQYVAQGEEQEQKDHLLEAQFSYQDAEQVAHTKEAARDLKRANDLIETRIEHLVAEAHGLYERGHPEDYAGAIAKLEEAQRYAPDRLLLNYDLAIVHKANKDPAGAIEYLDRCLYVLPEGRRRDELERMRAQIVTPEQVPNITSDTRDVFVKIDKLRQTDDNGFYNAEQKPTAGREPCPYLFSNVVIPQLPSILFNKTRCRETGHDQQHAVQLLDGYLNSATEALDQQQEKSHLLLLKSLASLPGDQGETVRVYYSEAARYWDVGRYDLVFRELTYADDRLPTYCPTKWRLAILHDGFGDNASTYQDLAAYLKCDDNAEGREQAVATMESLESRRAKYELAAQDAREPLSQVMEAYLKNGVNTRQRYVRSRLDRVFRDLGQALSMFPQGIEAHELLALVYELTNNLRLAKRSFDVLWTQGRAVAFFDAGGRRIEIQGDHFRIVNWIGNDPTAHSASADKGIPRDSVKATEVHEATMTVVLKSGSSVNITPARLAMPVSPKGPFARKYTNQYARLFQRYLGVDTLVLGKEGLSGKEKVEIGWDVFAIGFSVYSVTQAAKVAQYNQNIYNLLFYGMQTLQISHDVKEMYTLLQKQHQIAQDAPLKIIPTGPVHFEFREKF
jgi:hypothetical protein